MVNKQNQELVNFFSCCCAGVDAVMGTNLPKESHHLERMNVLFASCLELDSHNLS